MADFVQELENDQAQIDLTAEHVTLQLSAVVTAAQDTVATNDADIC